MNAQQRYAQNKRDEIARIVGEKPENIAVRGIDLMREGVIVSIHIGRWRGLSSLQMDDIGLSESEKSELMRLGVKTLMPPKLQRKMQSVEVAARNFLKSNGFSLTWGTFVPATAYRDVIDELERRRDDYLALANEIAGDDAIYNAWVAKLIDEYGVEARQAYRRAVTLERDAVEFYRDGYIVDENTFVANFRSRVRSAIPTRAEIFDSFCFEIERAYVPIASMLSADAAQRDEIVEAIETRVVSDLRERSETARLFVETEINEQAKSERERLLDEMNRDVVQDAQRKAQNAANDFVADMIAQLRQLAYDVSTDALDTLARNDSLHPRSVVALKNMIATIDALNFYGDADIEKMIAPLREQINRNANDRDVASVEQNLRDIATLSRSTLMSIGINTTRKGTRFASAAPQALDVSHARRRVGIVDEFESVEVASNGRRSSREF